VIASSFSGIHNFFGSGAWHVILNLVFFFLIAFWLAVGYWVYKDAKRRIEDPVLIATAVAIGLVIPYIGALVASLISGWTSHVRRQGLGVVVAATCWGIALVLFGFAHALWLALLMLALAGAADYVSAILRSVIVLTATPDEMRGRVTGIEFAQVASAPSLGNVEAGAVASATSLRFSIVSGGIVSVVGTLLIAAAVPALLRYDAKNPDA